jgi:protein gp37
MIHKIEWLNHPGRIGETWNPITGCTPISEGCEHCYAQAMAKRFRMDMTPGSLETLRLEAPYTWRRPRLVFVGSMCDMFHDGVSAEALSVVMDIIADDMRHHYVILTKRPRNGIRMLREYYHMDEYPPLWTRRGFDTPRRNLTIGVSVENQARAEERIPELLLIPAAHRMISCEPLLGPIELGDLTGIDWVVCGGETGPGARECRPEWAASIGEQCEAAGVPFSFKKLGNTKAPTCFKPVRQYPKYLEVTP